MPSFNKLNDCFSEFKQRPHCSDCSENKTPPLLTCVTPLYKYQKSRSYVSLALMDISSSFVLSEKTSVISSLMYLNRRSALRLVKKFMISLKDTYAEITRQNSLIFLKMNRLPYDLRLMAGWNLISNKIYKYFCQISGSFLDKHSCGYFKMIFLIFD